MYTIKVMSLPQEIIYKIIQFVNCGSLNALSKSSKQIKKMAEKQIKKRCLVHSCYKSNVSNIKHFLPDLRCCKIHDKNKEIMEIILTLNNKTHTTVHFSSNKILKKALPYLNCIGSFHICCGGTGVMFHEQENDLFHKEENDLIVEQ